MNAKTHIVDFNASEALDLSIVGGKGANLGRLTQARFEVPPGFVVTTDAYSAFLTETGLAAKLPGVLDALRYDDQELLEAATARLREAIVEASVPDQIATAIARAYEALGASRHVAVRSSGTAEDLEGASFAGMHDTYLDIQSSATVVDAVKRCWASLWTARAVSYRHSKGFNSDQIRIAVVVQVMVSSEVSGVMFTANPITAATDELVINASWGLGEMIVQGVVTPDEFTVKALRPLAVGFDRLHSGSAGNASTLMIKSRTLGSKEQRMVRNPASGCGTVTEIVSESERSKFSLSDAEIIELSELGRKVQTYYEEMPQDIEWGLAEGKFYLLQTRPVTGVAFDWAADMESFQWAPDDDNALWTGQFALLLTGAKSPMYYHWVTDSDSAGYYAIGNALDIPELMGPSYYTNNDADTQRPARHQIHKYYRGEVYLNGEFEKLMVEKTYLPILRTPEITPFLPPEYAKEIHAKPFDHEEFRRCFAHLKQVAPDAGLFEVIDRVQKFVDVDMAGDEFDASKLPDMTALSDAALKQALNDQWLVASRYTGYSMIVYFVYWQQMSTLMERMIAWWYDGDNKNAYAELCQGVNTRSKTQQENIGLYEFAELIRNSAALQTLFAKHNGADFFKALDSSDEGRAFMTKYREFVREHGHRGHEDRDFGYPRRFEDPSVDYRSLSILLSGGRHESPYEVEEKLANRRAVVLEDVLNNVRRDPFMGSLKADAIKTVHAWVLRFIEVRDDERWAYEKSLLCAKLYCREIGRRCVERGLLDDPEHFLMFTKDEMFDLLDGRMGGKLARAKAVARRRDYDRALERTHEFPMFMRDGREVATAKTEGGLIGTGWTSGVVTATARVVSRLSEVNRVKQGDILVCQSTDPGWTPVFMLLSGIVIETGGVLTHAVCLSREYGLPAVQLRGARKLIPDGATITINGATGEVVIVDEGEGEPKREPEATVAS